WLFEPVPSRASVAWAAAAGLVGAVGIASLYHGLAVGGAATVAPVAAVVTAAIPAVYTAFAVAPPSAWQLAGFLAAVAGIWLVTRQTQTADASSRKGIRQAVAAGIGFGTFLILIA